MMDCCLLERDRYFVCVSKTMTTNDLLAVLKTKIVEQQACVDNDDTVAAEKTKVKEATKKAVFDLLFFVSQAPKGDLTELTRSVVDTSLIDDAELLKWSLLHALKHYCLYRAFLGLPKVMEQTRRFLTTISSKKITELLLDGLCKNMISSCDSNNNMKIETIQWVQEVLQFISGAGRFKKQLGGFELQGKNKQILKTVINQMKMLQQRTTLDREAAVISSNMSSPSGRSRDVQRANFIDRDIRVIDQEKQTKRELALTSMVDQALSKVQHNK